MSLPQTKGAAGPLVRAAPVETQQRATRYLAGASAPASGHCSSISFWIRSDW